MKKRILAALGSLAIGLSAGQANAMDLIELRLGVGPSFVDADDFNRTWTAIDPGLELESIVAGHLEVLARPPILPIVAGLRYERGSAMEDVQHPVLGGTNWDLEYRRLSGVVGWRILDNMIGYLGPIVTVGLLHEAKLEQGLLGVTTNTDLDGDGVSATVGVEAGVNLMDWLLGGEIGYQSLKFEASDQFNTETDLSGKYIRFVAGYRF